MSGDRPNCRAADSCKAGTPGKHCPPCSLAALHKDPAFRAKRAAAFREKLANDPEFKAQHCAASSKRLKAWRQTEEGKAFTAANSQANLVNSNSPENTAKRSRSIRQKRLAGIAEERWPEYTRLARQMPAAEAKRIIQEDIAEQERRRLAAMTDFERAMERVRNGAKVVDKVAMPSRGYDFTLGGVSESLA